MRNEELTAKGTAYGVLNWRLFNAKGSVKTMKPGTPRPASFPTVNRIGITFAILQGL